ncbi:MAG: hypothetical protein EA395_14110 [Phormidium sp. GEM2.Bin31]|nr:MAG: hypothetical protein EA395_14110 [Phormidium sp. GEM2.Bin31]
MLSRRDRVIYNAATPAIDRAKAKLEFMFDRDREPRLPSGIPSQDLLLDIMLNQQAYEDGSDPGLDPYTLPDEERVDINSDGNLDNAWIYGEDSNGDGEDDLRIAYSIIWQFPDPMPNRAQAARDLLVSQGPVSSQPTPGCGGNQGQLIEDGWLRDAVSTAILRKNFQINAFVISGGENPAVTTLEVQQEREANRLNKWGAWFRNDLEIFPGPRFKWNGAMHTDGNLMIGHRRRTDQFQAYLVSGPGSCIYQAGPTTSEITIADSDDFTGQIMVGFMPEDISSGGGIFHIQPQADGDHPGNNNDYIETLTPQNDSIATGTPSQVALDPIRLFTEDVSRHRTPEAVSRDENWLSDNNPFQRSEEERIINQRSPRPFIDDFYRADDRYGPRPVYGGDDNLQLIQETRIVGGEEREVGIGVRVGDPIPNSPATAAQQDRLLRLEVDGDENPRELGLDGYWERRAWREGLRIIVGQRLELGNDPFESPTTIDNNSEIPQLVDDDKLTNNREHESLQRRSLRDNLAAVQTTALYHWSEGNGNPDQAPTAALVSTVHPGTAETLRRAAIFDQPRTTFGLSGDYSGLFGNSFGDDDDEKLLDFFTGRGTNGWELDLSRLDLANPVLNRALANLANFAGDPDGAFPPLQENGAIHPDPARTQWGNFSNLRRTLLDEDLGSLADNSNVHTAAITLGALAYNLSYLDGLNYASLDGNQLTALAERLEQLRDGDSSNGEVLFFPNEDLDGFDDYDYLGDISIDEDFYGNASLIVVNDNGKAITRMTPSPEAYIEALQYTEGNDEETEDLQELARLIYLKEQVKRDRLFGFLPSPTDDENYQADSSFEVNGFDDLEFPVDDNDVLELTADVCGENTPLGDCLEVVDINDSTEGEETVTVSFLTGWAIGQEEEYEIDSDGTLTIPLSLGCNVEENDFFGLGDSPEGVSLANRLCGATPKFPSLYYIFPENDSVGIGEQPESENDIPDDWVTSENRGLMDLGADLNNDGAEGDANDEIWYTSEVNDLPNPNAFSSADLASMALKPFPEVVNFVLPHEQDVNDCGNDDNGPNPNCQEFNLVFDGEDYHRVAVKDTAFFMGRDKMNTRALNLDMQLLTDNNQLINGDTWLPGGDDSQVVQRDGGLVYAFREDSIREDAVQRSPGGSCTTAGDIGNGCNTDVISARDPQVNPNNGISPKAVNFIPDPDRRLHGFRVINGRDISRPTQGTVPFGLSFVSDNPAFVQGDFNCHKALGSNNCDTVIEEFTSRLSENPDWGEDQFYTARRNISNRNNNFADPVADSWRYSEFLVDAFGILSENFCDGSVEDAFVVVPTTGNTHLYTNQLTNSLGLLGRGGAVNQNNGRLDRVYGCHHNGSRRFTSYSGFLRPNSNSQLDEVDDNVVWLRENPADLGSPIRIASSGNPQSFLEDFGDMDEGQYDGGYFDRTNRDLLVEAPREQRVNTMMISGITPSRARQSYGGLHNFPRFNEEWRDRNLWISGSFLQLSFSNYATGPYDQDAWEPGDDPLDPEFIGYYGAPERLWGYDVALQLSRVGPVSARQTRIDSPRSEFYREPNADDPYIRNLRCATDSSGEQIDPRVTNCP